ncbi:MAG TPA: ATP synthase F1 subunit gamma [Holophaga sp.]|nr:ATP synthase F1 subunit gamma [Holophaga sp.]
MASLQDIRRRIRSVKNTQQITKAMKMISAVKLRKSQERLVSLRPYVGKLLEIVRNVVSRFQSDDQAPWTPLIQAFLAPREEKRLRVVVVAGEKGLCGGFNANLFKVADAFLRERKGSLVHLDVAGKRAADWARKHGLKVGRELIGVPLPEMPRTAQELTAEAIRQYAADEIDALYVIYNEFTSPVTQTPTVLKAFPMDVGALPKAEVPHLLEPDPVTVLEAILPHCVETEVLSCFLESSAAEHGARMSAMDKASSNAAEMIDRLTLNMNKIRQASITNQIIEIVSGANA